MRNYEILSLTILPRHQKESPYLEDMNRLIGLANQKGLVHGIFNEGAYTNDVCGWWGRDGEDH